MKYLVLLLFAALTFPSQAGLLITPRAPVASPSPSAWVNSISASGATTLSRPACSDLSNGAASCSTDTTNAANISSGTLPAGRLPAFTSDVTTTIGTVATTVAKIQGTAVSGTTGSGNVAFSAGPTFTGTLNAAAITASGAVSATTHIVTAPSVTSPALDSSGAASYTITANGSAQDVGAITAAGTYYLISVGETGATGATAIWICGGGACTLVSQVGGTAWVAQTTTPTTLKFSISFASGGYHIYANYTNSTGLIFKVNAIRIA